ncbi:hypothetical protein Bbelb_190180 [Branchiostoma belcheri]|nr:hypothetical protein Bbelb_190180 [Branchiostoma belcheri]
MKTLLVVLLVTAILIHSSESTGVLLERLESEIKQQRHLASKKNGQDVVINPDDDWYSPMMGKRTSFDGKEDHDLRPMEAGTSGHKARSEFKVDEGSGQS